jgi:hypothetical protein
LSNVIKFEGAMRPDADREDRKTEHVRGMHDSAMRGLAPVIETDNSLLARLVRAVRRLLRSAR